MSPNVSFEYHSATIRKKQRNEACLKIGTSIMPPSPKDVVGYSGGTYAPLDGSRRRYSNTEWETKWYALLEDEHSS